MGRSGVVGVCDVGESSGSIPEVPPTLDPQMGRGGLGKPRVGVGLTTAPAAGRVVPAAVTTPGEAEVAGSDLGNGTARLGDESDLFPRFGGLLEGQDSLAASKELEGVQGGLGGSGGSCRDRGGSAIHQLPHRDVGDEADEVGGPVSASGNEGVEIVRLVAFTGHTGGLDLSRGLVEEGLKSGGGGYLA